MRAAGKGEGRRFGDELQARARKLRAIGAMRPRLTANALVAGRYQLLEPVADRGLGETWRVADRRREVGLRSIKFLAETPDGATPEGALAAIRALAVMRHGAIPSALQHGVHGGRPWVVFHDVRGESVGPKRPHGHSGCG